MPDQKSSFSPDEICRIIEVCAKAGVSSIESGNLKLSFLAQVPVQLPVRPEGGQTQPQPATNHEEQSQASLEIDELHEKEERIAMMILEDPLEFERQLVAGDLEEMIDDDGSDGPSEET